LVCYAQCPDETIKIRFRYSDDISRLEIALYRLMILSIVSDYMVSYGQSPCFEVHLFFDRSAAAKEKILLWKEQMRANLVEYLRHWENGRNNPIDLTRIESYRPLSDFGAKTKKFKMMEKFPNIFQSVYEHLLLILDHVYKDVVYMRYDMLWNLLSVVRCEQEHNCQRIKILPHFEGDDSVDDNYRCGCCNVCSPTLDFLDRVRPRTKNLSVESTNLELDDLFNRNDLDIEKLRKICDVFREYRTATYSRARAVLEGSSNNLPALYLTREFSPPAELEANTRRLLRTANERLVPILQLRDLYKGSASQFKSSLLLLLNAGGTTCDSSEGWHFLLEETESYMKSGDIQMNALHDCLDFFVLVDEMLPAGTESFRKRAEEMEEILNA